MFDTPRLGNPVRRFLVIILQFLFWQPSVAGVKDQNSSAALRRDFILVPFTAGGVSHSVKGSLDRIRLV